MSPEDPDLPTTPDHLESSALALGAPNLLRFVAGSDPAVFIIDLENLPTADRNKSLRALGALVAKNLVRVQPVRRPNGKPYPDRYRITMLDGPATRMALGLDPEGP